MPPALDRLTRIANIRPVDLAQAAIGPGMEIYSRYSKVTRISGEVVPIREVLKEINNEITAYHEKETGELDLESQFCLTWQQQHGYMEGNYGDALVLATAKGVDIDTMHDKVLLKDRSKVRLLRAEEYVDRENSEEMTAWEGCLTDGMAFIGCRKKRRHFSMYRCCTCHARLRIRKAFGTCIVYLL